MSSLIEPFQYAYMTNAIAMSALVGAVCAFLSAYLMLKGWSLIGDALSHSVVPGVAGAYILGLPFAVGAFFAGGLAAATMLFLRKCSDLKEDAIVGLVFTFFFGLGLFMVSISPVPVPVTTILFGNILAIEPHESMQLVVISAVSMVILLAKWKDLMLAFFDEAHARTIGLNLDRLRVLFFALLAACTVAAMQAVGAILVIAMVVTPGATAYLLADRFEVLIAISVAIGVFSAAVGAYLSFFLNGATGGVIVCLQTLVFLLVFFLAPQHGLFARRRKSRA